MSHDLNSFYRKLLAAQPATDVNPTAGSGLDKDHFALIQEHLFFAQIIFDAPTNLMTKFTSGQRSGPQPPRRIRDTNKFEAKSRILETHFNFNVENLIIPLLIRSVSLPNASTNASENEINNDFGKVVFPSKGSLIPDTNVIIIQFMNTEQNILEHLIYDWIIETKSNKWVYDTHAFTRATIRINYLDQKGESIIFSYDFHDAFPIAYDTINSNHNAEANIERGATFNFNWFSINSDKQILNQESVISKMNIPPLKPNPNSRFVEDETFKKLEKLAESFPNSNNRGRGFDINSGERGFDIRKDKQSFPSSSNRTL